MGRSDVAAERVDEGDGVKYMLLIYGNDQTW
ncbi:MAG: hypothetical protein QOF10_4406, partial [Kribbellaceae bacterium]|nr:hypothetical protein [Kribbellaceae bacterium]